MISTYIESLLARLIALIGPFGAAVITARLLGPEDRGRYYYLMTLVTIGVQLASFGIQSSNSYMISKQASTLARILINSVWIALVGGCVAAAGVVAFELYYGSEMRNYVLIAFVFIQCPTMLLVLYLTNIAVAIQSPRRLNITIIFNSAAILFSTLAVAAIAPNLQAFLSAAAVASIATALLAWFLVGRNVATSFRFDTSLFLQGIVFAARVQTGILLSFLMARVSVILLRSADAFNELGHWSVAAQVADALLIFPSTAAMLLFPALVRAALDDRWKQFKKAAWQMGIFLAAACLGVGLLAFWVVPLVFGDAYSPSVILLVGLLPSVFFLGVASVASQFLTAFGVPIMQLVGWGLSLAMQLLLSIALFRAYGGVGLALAQSAGAGFICCWLLVLAFFYAPHRRPPDSAKRDGASLSGL